MAFKNYESTPKYEVLEVFGKLGKDSKKELRVISWNGREPKYDIREWKLEDGTEKPCKGVTLSLEELLELGNIINENKED